VQFGVGQFGVGQFEVGQFEVVSLIAAERSFEGAWP
jgi:hypothetical protein